MKVTVIGCDGAYPSVNGGTSSYLIQDDNINVLLDCGSGCISRLQNHIELKDLDGIVISHYHRDHYADLECMQYAMMIDMLQKKRSNPLIIYGCGKEEMLSYKKYCIGKSYKDEGCFSIGSFTFSTCANVHGVESYCIKVTSKEGSTLVYTGDTSYYKNLAQFSKGAKCLIAEASLYEGEEGKVKGHMTSKEAATVAEEANVEKLVLSHLPHYGDVNNLVIEAEKYFHKEIVLSKCDLIIDL